jgi:hypothetical protein
MGFDQNDNQPVIHPRRWGTKVNFGIIAGVLLFVVAGIVGMMWVDRNQDQVTSGVHPKVETQP